MSAFKPYRELSESLPNQDELFPIVDAHGYCYGWAQNEDDAKRFIECWNACRKIAFPGAHIDASEEYVKRLEQLRKDAWARAEALQSEIDQLKAARVSA